MWNFLKRLPAAVSYALGGVGTVNLWQSYAPPTEDTDMSLEQVTAVNACINILSGTMASMRLYVERYDAQTRDFNRDVEHPLNAVLSNPSRLDNEYLFYEQVYENLFGRGNAFARILRTQAGLPFSMVYLPPNSIQEINIINGQRFFKAIIRQREERETRVVDLTDNDVLHLPGPGFNGKVSPSPVSMAQTAIITARRANQTQASLFTNRSFAQGAFVLGDNITPENAEKWNNKLNQDYKGAMNAGKIPVMPPGTDFKQFGVSSSDAEVIATWKFSIEEIARVWNVPLFLLQHLQSGQTWGGTLEQQWTNFLRFSIFKHVRRCEAELNRKLIPVEVRDDYRIRYDREELTRATFRETSESVEMLMRAGVITPNDARRYLKLPVITDDELADRLPAPTGAPMRDENAMIGGDE